MIIARDNRVGIDAAIYRLQTLLNENLTWLGTNIYGRIYRNKDSEGKFHPETWIEGDEYSQVFVNDNNAGNVGFYVKDVRTITSGIMEADIEIIFTVDVTGIYGTELRDDEKALLEASQILVKAITKGFTINDSNNVKINNEKVFADFDRESIAYRDMQPYFNFSISGKLEYSINLCLK